MELTKSCLVSYVCYWCICEWHSPFNATLSPNPTSVHWWQICVEQRHLLSAGQLYCSVWSEPTNTIVMFQLASQLDSPLSELFGTVILNVQLSIWLIPSILHWPPNQKMFVLVVVHYMLTSLFDYLVYSCNQQLLFVSFNFMVSKGYIKTNKNNTTHTKVNSSNQISAF